MQRIQIGPVPSLVLMGLFFAGSWMLIQNSIAKVQASTEAYNAAVDGNVKTVSAAMTIPKHSTSTLPNNQH